jgi:hypothetical protein
VSQRAYGNVFGLLGTEISVFGRVYVENCPKKGPKPHRPPFKRLFVRIHSKYANFILSDCSYGYRDASNRHIARAEHLSDPEGEKRENLSRSQKERFSNNENRKLKSDSRRFCA